MISCCLCHKTILKVISDHVFRKDGIAHKHCHRDLKPASTLKKKTSPNKRGRPARYNEELLNPEFKFEYDEEVYQEEYAIKKARAVVGFPCAPDRTMREGKTLHRA